MNNENRIEPVALETTVQIIQETLQKGEFKKAVVMAGKALEANPEDVFCLSVVAQSEFGLGNLSQAKEYLLRALALQPNDLILNRNLGLLFNKEADFEASIKSFIQGVESNADHPGVLLDVLLLAISLNKIDKKLSSRLIEMVFSQSLVLKNAYKNSKELPVIVEASHIANGIARDEKFSSQKSTLDELSLGFNDNDTERLYGFLDVFHGIKSPFYPDDLQRPTYHVFPGLKPLPFYSAEKYAWADELEKNWKEIKKELIELYNDSKNVKPYIDGVVTGVKGLDGLANSLDWSSIHLIKGGDYKIDLLNKSPVTKFVLNNLPMPVLDGNAPEAFLSVLKPGAEIKPHFGLSNLKLTVHLGLEIPENCAIRVGNETKQWEDGKVLIFDDSFEHEAWNKSDKERKVFILEVWHPDLTELEKQGIQKIMEMQNAISQLAQADTIDSLISKVKNLS